MVQLFRLFGFFFALAIAIAIKNIFDVKKYKEKFRQIVAMEKENLLTIFEAVP